MQVANKVKSERILGLQNRGIKQWEKIKQENMPLLTWLCKYEQSDGNFAKSTLKGRKEMRHKIEQYLATTGDINICLSEIDVDFCRGFVKFLKTAHNGVKKDATAVISQGCAHHHQAVFNGALNKAVREGIIASNPMKLLDAKEKHQPAESVREYLTIDELKAIMKADCANTEVKRHLSSLALQDCAWVMYVRSHGTRCFSLLTERQSLSARSWRRQTNLSMFHYQKRL